MVCMVIIPGIDLQMSHLLKTCKLILRGRVALLVTAVLPKDLSYQAAVQTLLVNQVKAALADCSWAVSDYLLLRGLNQVLSPNHHHLIIVLLGQEVVVMIHSGALNSCHLALEKGNEELTLIKQTSWVKQGSWFCSHTFSLKDVYPCWLLCIFSIQCWVHSRNFFMKKLWKTPLISLLVFFHEYFSMDGPIHEETTCSLEIC